MQMSTEINAAPKLEPQPAAKAKTRLQSLDIVRGITVAGMILVNNGHSGSFELLQHSKWNGLTLSDLVFPFFLFIMGVSMYLSFSSRGFKLTWPTSGKILKRSVLLIVLGLAINWFDKAVAGNILCFETLRYWAVLQRIALCYLIMSFLVLTVPHKALGYILVGLLIGYDFLLKFGHGWDYDASTNLLAQVDLNLFGYDHIYHKSPVDPEGLVGTLGSLINVLIGFMCGMQLKINKHLEVKGRSKLMAMFGAGYLIAGLLFSLGDPINKRVWSPSFALITSGLCQLLLAGVMYMTDWRHPGKIGASAWNFFKVFGVNALVIYIASEFLAIVLAETGVSDAVFNGISAVISIPQLASLCYAILFVLLNFAIGYPLYKKKIYIKL